MEPQVYNEQALQHALSPFIEDCYFFQAVKKPDEFLYGRIYIPSAECSTTGIVIVGPIGYERLRRYREIVSLARDLAHQKYPVIYFDQQGEGESSGEFQNFNLTTRVEDITSAVHELKRHAEVDELVLIGIRLGAVLAVLGAAKHHVKRLVLCDPICNPANYAIDLLRGNIVLQQQYQGNLKTTPELREHLKQGGTISIYGFPMGYSLLEELEQINLMPYLEKFTGRTVLLHFVKTHGSIKKDIAHWEQLLKTHGECETIGIESNFAWTEKKFLTSRLDVLNEEIIRWLKMSASQNPQ
jgi:pimeloyl-ACP methyl ester carboxylesterase